MQWTYMCVRVERMVIEFSPLRSLTCGEYKKMDGEMKVKR